MRAATDRWSYARGQGPNAKGLGKSRDGITIPANVMDEEDVPSYEGVKGPNAKGFGKNRDGIVIPANVMDQERRMSRRSRTHTTAWSAS